MCIFVILLSAPEWKNLNIYWLFLASLFIFSILTSLFFWHSAKHTWRWFHKFETKLLTMAVGYYAKSMISYKPIAGLVNNNPWAAELVWCHVILFAIANFATCEAIVSFKLTVTPLFIFFILFISFLIFFLVI